jgi:hypothetical protein
MLLSRLNTPAPETGGFLQLVNQAERRALLWRRFWGKKTLWFLPRILNKFVRNKSVLNFWALAGLKAAVVNFEQEMCVLAKKEGGGVSVLLG